MALTKDEVYYFAFGSNMNEERMRKRSVHFTERQCAKLSGYAFKLHKVLKNGTAAANVMETTTTTENDDCVYGALYRIQEKGLLTLDKFEHRGKSYDRKDVIVEITSTGEKVKAVTYVALSDKIDDDLKKVATDYLHHILQGRDILPKNYVEWIEKSFTGWCVGAVCQK